MGRKGQCRDGETVLDSARNLEIGINSICGGEGICGACRIQIIEGRVTTPTPKEKALFSSHQLSHGWRLACQSYPLSDCKLYVPPESMSTPQRTQTESVEIHIPTDPPANIYIVEMSAPSLSTVNADADSFLRKLNERHKLTCNAIDIEVLRMMSPCLRELNWHCMASVRNTEVISIGSSATKNLGLAIDLGTTKIAIYLVDLDNGRTLASKGIMNPQISFGEDIITRINVVIRQPNKASRMQKLVANVLNQAIGEFCSEVGIHSEEITEAVIVGNTAMHHLFLSLPVKQLALSPYVPAVSAPLDIKARDVGLNTGLGAYIHFLPNIAGFVGSDHVAMLLAAKAWEVQEPTIMLDIGTNTEISLIKDGNITSVSCASGPAFEGYYIQHGMRAAGGAIEKIRIVDGNIKYQTIDNLAPVGICGSGILDALAQLYQAGIIDRSGRMQDGHPRMRKKGRQREFILVSSEERDSQGDIVISQKDVRELQLAKSAIRTGIELLMKKYQLAADDIAQVVIAGAFGSYIDVSSAIAIGMFPDIPHERFNQIGNAAGMGARLALISATERKRADDLASHVDYIELATSPDFTQIFIQAGYLG